MAVLRIEVGKSSENKEPNPPNIPVPNPTMNIKPRMIRLYSTMVSQNRVTIISPSAMITE